MLGKPQLRAQLGVAGTKQCVSEPRGPRLGRLASTSRPRGLVETCWEAEASFPAPAGRSLVWVRRTCSLCLQLGRPEFGGACTEGRRRAESAVRVLIPISLQSLPAFSGGSGPGPAGQGRALRTQGSLGTRTVRWGPRVRFAALQRQPDSWSVNF